MHIDALNWSASMNDRLSENWILLESTRENVTRPRACSLFTRAISTLVAIFNTLYPTSRAARNKFAEGQRARNESATSSLFPQKCALWIRGFEITRKVQSREKSIKPLTWNIAAITRDCQISRGYRWRHYRRFNGHFIATRMKNSGADFGKRKNYFK